MVEILSLVLHYDEADVEAAIDQAIKIGHPSKEHVINCLSAIISPVPLEPLPIVTKLKLSVEPTANTSRYEQLIGKYHAH